MDVVGDGDRRFSPDSFGRDRPLRGGRRARSGGPARGVRPPGSRRGGQHLRNQQVSAPTQLGKLVLFGLGHAVKCAQLERLQRDVGPLLRERTDHHDFNTTKREQERKRLEPRDLRHFHIKRDHIRAQPRGFEYRLAPVGRGAHDFDLRRRLEQVGQQAADQRRIVNDQDPDRFPLGPRVFSGVVLPRFVHVRALENQASLESRASTRWRSNGLTMKSIAPSRIESSSTCFWSSAVTTTTLASGSSRGSVAAPRGLPSRA